MDTGALTAKGLLTPSADFYTVDYTDYSSTSTVVGWSGFDSNAKQIWYKKIGKTVFVWFYISGTSNSATHTFTLPFAMYNHPINLMSSIQIYSGSAGTGIVYFTPNDSYVSFLLESTGTLAPTGAVGVRGIFCYQTT